MIYSQLQPSALNISLSLLSLGLSIDVLCSLLVALSPLSAAPTQSQQQAARLAVLELSGGYGSIPERQRWSSYARAEALSQLRGSGVRVIDRDDFVQLLPPGRSLEDCAGQCSAQLAREVGAHWVLSGSVEVGAEALHLTLQLHSASGELLAVAQRSLSKQSSDATLAVEIKALSAEALDPISTQPRLSPQEEEPPPIPLRTQLSSPAPSAVEAAASAPSRAELSPLAWWGVKTAEGARCLSEALRRADYLVCVEEGACAPTPTRDGCRGAAGAALTCVDLSQAMSYLRWRAKRDNRPYRLPSLTALKLLKSVSAEALHAQVSMEWLDGSKNPDQVLSRAALRRAPKVDVARYERGARFLAVRPYPPAFQLPELGFRLSYSTPRTQPCGPL